jgi:hypothetical protein
MVKMNYFWHFRTLIWRTALPPDINPSLLVKLGFFFWREFKPDVYERINARMSALMSPHAWCASRAGSLDKFSARCSPALVPEGRGILIRYDLIVIALHYQNGNRGF